MSPHVSPYRHAKDTGQPARVHRAGQYLGWVGLQPGAAAVEDSGLSLCAHRLRVAAAAPLLAALKTPAMIPAEQLAIFYTAHT